MKYGAYVSHEKDGTCKCGYMDLHTDEHCHVDGYYKISVHWIDPRAAFVHTVGGKLIIEDINDGDVLSFKCIESHGLYPRAIAEMICNGQLNDKQLIAIDQLINESEMDAKIHFSFVG